MRFTLIVLCVFVLCFHSTVSAETTYLDLKAFLDADTTDLHQWTEWYYCGHFTRDLAHNASKYNITLGAAIISNQPMFKGHQNHIINYIIINDTFYFIEPQTDTIMSIGCIFSEYKYVRLYPDGTQVPSNWIYNLAPTMTYEDW